MSRILIPIVMICMFAAVILPAHAGSAGSKPLDPMEAERLVDMARLGKAAKTAIGSDWQSTAVLVRSLQGWQGRVNGVSITFTNDRLLVDSAPATFRITHTNWEDVSPSVDKDANSDIPLSVTSHGYWYCSPGNFGIVYPDKWEDTLRSLREFFGLPEANNGIVCLLETSKDIFPIGTPVDLGVRLVRLPGAEIATVNECTDVWQHLVITDSSGKVLPALRYPEHAHTRRKMPRDLYTSIQNLEQYFPISRPGSYKATLLYPFDTQSDRLAKSQEIDIQIVPEKFITLRLKRLSDEPLSSHRALPVELELRVNDGDLSQVSELKLGYNGSRSEQKPLSDIYGSPGHHMTEDIMGQLQAIDNHEYHMSLDLAAGYWDEGSSSIGPHKSLWACTASGSTWRISASISGKMDGKRFHLSSNELVFQQENR